MSHEILKNKSNFMCPHALFLQAQLHLFDYSIITLYKIPFNAYHESSHVSELEINFLSLLISEKVF